MVIPALLLSGNLGVVTCERERTRHDLSMPNLSAANRMLAGVTPIQLPPRAETKKPKPTQSQPQSQSQSGPEGEPSDATPANPQKSPSVSVSAQGHGHGRGHGRGGQSKHDQEEDEKDLIILFLAIAVLAFLLMCGLNRWANGAWYGSLPAPPAAPSSAPAPTSVPTSVPSTSSASTDENAPPAPTPRDAGLAFAPSLGGILVRVFS